MKRGMTSKRFMLIAGEASGDTLAAELIRALKESEEMRSLPEPPAFFGAGGPRMAAAGAELAFDLAEHAVVGIWEVLKNYGKFKGFFDRLLNLAKERQPDVIILIDYPGFNLRFAKAIKAFVRSQGKAFHNWNPKVVFYVSPQIWAWHESRVHQIARDIDLLISIFPFEKAWYAARVPNFRVEFAGHPLIDRYAATPFAHSGQAARAGLAETMPLIVLLPGSRRRELQKHLDPVLGAARIIGREVSCRFRLVAPNAEMAALARQRAETLLPGLEIVTEGLADSLAEARLAIASSGTVTMECAYFQTPAVVLYRTSPINYFLGRKLVKVKHLAMPNLLAGEEIYPEFIQHEATAENLAASALHLLNNFDRRTVVRTRLAAVVDSLGEPGASHRAAKAILSLLPLA